LKELRKQFFFEKKNQKTFAPWCAWLVPVMPAQAGIHDFRASSHPALLNCPFFSNSRKRQKFFAELFFKKATASFL